jgi:beta-lactamase regulating signal transducer with metallopeptidase domain
LLILGWSLARVVGFHRRLRSASEPAPDELEAAAEELADRLALSSRPTLRVTSARLSPLVWWVGGAVQVVVPHDLMVKLPAHAWRWVLAHELAHVRRRDYLVRWVEWLACVTLWWNPLTWVARRHLRANEEICCDGLVLSRLAPRPCAYADALLNAIECLALPLLRPPAMASEINGGGHLRRRFNMILSAPAHRPRSPWMPAAALVLAGVILPLGLATAGGENQRERYRALEVEVRAAVDEGEMTEDQAVQRLARAHRRTFGQEPLDRAYEERIQAAVASGAISERDVRQRLREMRPLVQR